MRGDRVVGEQETAPDIEDLVPVWWTTDEMYPVYFISTERGTRGMVSNGKPIRRSVLERYNKAQEEFGAALDALMDELGH